MSWIKREPGEGEGEKKYLFARWMSWLFLAASVLVLIYTYYRAEITYRGGMSAVYFKYYVISLAGILFWGVVLRLREGIRANIVTVVISLVVGLYLVEGGLTFLRLGQPGPRAAAVAAELGVEYDERLGLGVIEDLIAEGVDAVPMVGPLHGAIGVNKEDIDDLFPLAGVANKITVYGNESGKYLIYKSDRHGFNNPDSQWDSKELEWLLTGDSFTHGASVQPGQEIAGQLRSITGNRAISLGIGGNGPLMELAELTEYAGTIKAKKVLWIYYEGNDLSGNLQDEKINPLLMQYMQDGFSQNLIGRQKEIDSRLEEYIVSSRERERELSQREREQRKRKAQHNKTLWMRLGAIRSVISFDVDVDVDVDDPLFAKILTKAKARVGTWEGELYFVYLPEYSRYSGKGVSHDSYRKKAEVIALVKGLNIPVIDIHQEVFSDHPDPLALFPFRLFGHYNADGYAEVAKAIVAAVKKNRSNSLARH